MIKLMIDDAPRKITIEGMEIDRWEDTAPDGRWIVDCDRCGGSGHGRYSHWERLEGGGGRSTYNPCSECDGRGITLQEPIDPIKPCLMTDHEWRVIYNEGDGLSTECLDPHSQLVRRAMRTHPDHSIGALHGCDYLQEYMDFSLRVKMNWVNYCSDPGGWHGLERCDCGGGITIIEVLENEGAQGY